MELQDAGIEADIWKIEGIDTQEDCARISETCRRDGRDGVICVVLGRGANDDKVDHWLRQGAPVEGYAGFAIGRTIWWDALKGFLDGDLDRDEAASQIAENYLRFVQVYERGGAGARHRMSALLRVRERRQLARSAGSLPPTMRMRQSLAQFEEAFREEAAESIVRRERLRKQAAQRSRVRRVERAQQAGHAALHLPRRWRSSSTAVIVTIVMFETLAMLAG